MARLADIELLDGTRIPVLYEDRSVLAIDKPPGWMLAPSDWDRTGRNLQLALESAIVGGNRWARSRGIKFLRFVHRLDAETSGALLLVKSLGAVEAYSQLFEERRVDKLYLAVVEGLPRRDTWVNDKPVGNVPSKRGLRSNEPKDAITSFTVLQRRNGKSLILAHPLTGRTHQIRVHVASDGFPVWGDAIYGKGRGDLALRSTVIAYRDPFTRKQVHIEAPWETFTRNYGFELSRDELYQGAQRQSLK